MRRAVVILALAGCGSGSAKPKPDAAVDLVELAPVTAPDAEREGGQVIAQVDDIRWVIGAQGLVDLAVEAPGYGGVYTPRGLRLTRVGPGTIAARVGLQPGDIVTTFRDADDVQAAWLALRKDESVTIAIERGADKLERHVFLADNLMMLSPFQKPSLGDLELELIDALRTGVSATEIDREALAALATPGLLQGSMRERYGRAAAQIGVGLEEDSPLTALGLTRWDTIHEIDGATISNPASVEQAIAKPPGATLKISYYRIADPLTLELRVVDGLVDKAKLTAVVERWSSVRAAAAERAADAQAAADAMTAEIAKHVTRVDDTHYTIDRVWLNSLIDDPDVISKGARITPSLKNGQSNGIKLYAIRPSSIYAKLGFANGDTIHAVNGRALDVAAASAIWESLRKVKTATFEMTRRGKPLVLEYKLK